MSAAEFSYLWDGSSIEWVLVMTGDATTNEPTYLPANLATQSALIIEDDAVSAEVIAMMLERGCRVVTPDEWRREAANRR